MKRLSVLLLALLFVLHGVSLAEEYMYKNAIGCNKDINAAKKYEDMTKAKENKSIK